MKKTVTEERILNIDLSNIDFIISSIDLQIMQCLVVKVNVILKESDYRLIENAMEKLFIKIFKKVILLWMEF